MNYAKHTHDCLVGAIRAMTPTDNSRKPGTYFTRNRKFSFEDVILHLISSGRGSINEEVRKYSIANGRDVCEAPSKSAVCQQRNKLSAEALPHLFHAFNDCFDTELFHGFQLIAVDGLPFPPVGLGCLHPIRPGEKGTLRCPCNGSLRPDDPQICGRSHPAVPPQE